VGAPGPWPRARGQVVEPDQIDVLAASVLGDRQEVFHIGETRLAREIVGDVVELDRLDRFDLDLAIIHRIASADFDVRAHPDADAAADASASNAFAKTLGKDHSKVYR
jgi:hypothetical protein